MWVGSEEVGDEEYWYVFIVLKEKCVFFGNMLRCFS
jgi:hypothetical protein